MSSPGHASGRPTPGGSAWKAVVLACACGALAPWARAEEPPALPREGQFAWSSASPESQGLSSERLARFRDELAAAHTQALLVIRNDRIVLEWYAAGFGPDSMLATASTAKAIVGGVSAALEIGDGLIALDDPAAKFVPAWRQDRAKAKITVGQLGSHTSGLDDAEQDELGVGGAAPARVPHEKLSGWKGDFWKRLQVPDDPFTIARDRTPLIFAPGERFSYSNPGMAMLSYVLTAALARGQERDLRSLLRDRVMRPIGIQDGEWDIGYKQTFLVDGLPIVPVWGGGSFSARSFARIARLMLRRGSWDGQQLLDAHAVAAVTLGANAAGPSQVATGWWNNARGTISNLPRNVYFASGAGNRLVVVIPGIDAIVVRNGDLLSPIDDYFVAQDKLFFQPMIRALQIVPSGP